MYERISLQQRSSEKELLDSENIPFVEIQRIMRELDTINTWLGGHAITIEGFKQLLGNRRSVHVCEIGCGDGNNLQQLYKWCKKNKIIFRSTGIDIKQECIEAAKERVEMVNADWVVSDYRNAQLAIKPDIIFSSLFCHHFSDEELKEQLSWMQQNATSGFFINDLQRHWFAYHSIKIITKLFSSSRQVKHDAPLSVARAFSKKEWMEICRKADIENYSIQWKWAFRYLIIYKHAG